MFGDCPNITTLRACDIYGERDADRYFYYRTYTKYSPVGILEPEDFAEVEKAANRYKYNYNNYRNSDDHISRKLFKMHLFEVLDKNNELISL